MELDTLTDGKMILNFNGTSLVYTNDSPSYMDSVFYDEIADVVYVLDKNELTGPPDKLALMNLRGLRQFGA